jgi:uncharacterized protein
LAIVARYRRSVPVDPSAENISTQKSAQPAASPIQSAPSISIGIAAATWLAGWLGGNIAGSIVLAASGTAGRDAADRPAWVAVVSALALWIPQVAALIFVSQRFATGKPFADYGLKFKPIDLVGIPVGVLSQLVVLRLVYWPLQAGWPGAFSNKHLEQNAKDLYDTAHGIWLVLLILTLAVGAPLVEELVYRGLLMGAARRRVNDVIALVAVAAFFALIHFRPVEYPGLFAFGLVLGACVLATDRIGMSIVAHMAFNVTAIALVAH